MKQMTVREARRHRGLTQDELAAASGVDQTTISDLETGRNTNPSYNTIQSLARALKFQPSRLRFGQDETVTS